MVHGNLLSFVTFHRVTNVRRQNKNKRRRILIMATPGPHNYQPPSAEQLSVVSPLRDGVIEDSAGSPAARGCDDRDRLKRDA